MNSQPKKGGRTLKSAICIVQLDDDQYYTPAEVARLGADPVSEGLQYRRFVESLGSFSRNHNFQMREGQKQGQRYAWQGRYWKKFVKPGDLQWAQAELEKNQADEIGENHVIYDFVVSTASEQSWWASTINGKPCVSSIAKISSAALLIISTAVFLLFHDTKNLNSNAVEILPKEKESRFLMKNLAITAGKKSKGLPVTKVPEGLVISEKIKKPKSNSPELPSPPVSLIYATMYPAEI